MITTAGTFYMYAVFCAFGVFYVIFVVPETRGKDLDAISKLFTKNRSESQLTTMKTAATNKGYQSSSMNSLQNGNMNSDSNLTKL